MLVVLFSTYKLRNHFQNLDTVKIQRQVSENKDNSNKLDEILYKHIESFTYIHSFDHLFGNKSYKYHLNTLWVDQCEVRQGDFYKFIKWQSNNPQVKISSAKQPLPWAYKSISENHKISGRIQAPANGITYYDASAYCKAAGGRLPTKSEWIAIAGGKKRYLYPWGNKFVADAWPYLDSRLNASQKCGKHPKNFSANYELYNLGDSVSEWASPDIVTERPSIHGGNAYNKPFELYSLTDFYRYSPATYRSPYVGFRCVYGNQPQPIKWTKKIKTVRIAPDVYTLNFPENARIPQLLAQLSQDKIEVIKNIFNYRQKDKTFRILRHEVTRSQYNSFLSDPLVKLGIYANSKEPENHTYIPLNWSDSIDDNKNDLPVTGIDWWSAWAFAKWAGGRLPSAIEWTAAASNLGLSVYPWGNSFALNSASAENKYLTEKPIYSHPKDKTNNGIYDMGGNVSEWTNSIIPLANHYVAVLKGGNYSLPSENTAKIDFENQAPLSLKSPTVGFRIVFD